MVLLNDQVDCAAGTSSMVGECKSTDDSGVSLPVQFYQNRRQVVRSGCKRTSDIVGDTFLFQFGRINATLRIFTTFFLLYTSANAQWQPEAMTALQLQQQQQLPLPRISLYAPVLRTKSLNGYLLDSVRRGDMVRVSPTANADVFQILVHDDDLKSGMPSALYQYIVTGYGAEKFAIDSYGNLFLNANNLDTGTSVYYLNVTAVEVGTDTMLKSQTLSIKVHVVTPNDNPPRFAKAVYLANVTAHGAERTVLRVEATDPDSGESGHVKSYHIISVNDDIEGLFRYDFPSKELRALRTLTAGHTYQIILEATDTGGLTGQTTIFVYASLPESLYSPYSQQFYSLQQQQQQQQQIAQHEQQATQTAPNAYPKYFAEMIAQMMQNSAVSAPSAEMNKQQFYSQQPQEGIFPMPQQQIPSARYYSQQQKNSAEMTQQQMHRQQQQIISSNPQTQTEQQFSLMTNAQLIQTQQQQILPTASDVGQFNRRLHGPNSGSDTIIRHEIITVELSEAAPPNSIVIVLGDANSISRLYYWIADEDRNDNFIIDYDSGSVSTVRFLDREKAAYHLLKIQTRSRNPDQLLYWTILNITIMDENDNPPTFIDTMPAFFNMRIDERTRAIPPNQTLGRLTVRDSDEGANGRVTLRIISPTDRLFTINNDGVLSINGVFTRAHFGEHQLVVVAMDGGIPALETQGQVVVNIEDARADSSDSQASLSAASSDSASHAADEIPAAMFSRATLPPSALEMSTPTEMTSLFTMISGVASLGTNNANYVPGSAETLAVTPKFNRFTGLPSITVNSVLDTPTTTSSPPETSTASHILPLTTTAHRRYFAPVFQTPVILLAVEENDEDVELCRLEAKYPEALPETLRQSATITYLLEEGDKNMFALNATTGVLTLTQPLDVEKVRVHTVRVGTREAHDLNMFVRSNALSHSATITIQVLDINDYIPNFEQDIYRLRVKSDAPVGTILGQVTAYDNDADAPNNKITYGLLNDDGLDSFFTIDAESGVIRLANRVDDFGGDQLILKLVATDCGDSPQNATADAIIEVQGGAPKTTTLLLPSSPTMENHGNNNNNETPQDEDGEDSISDQRSENQKFSTNIRSNVAAEMEAEDDGKSDEDAIPSRIRFSAQNFTANILEGVRGPVLVASLPLVFEKANIDTRFLICALANGNIRSTFDVVPSAQRNSCELRALTLLDREALAKYRLNVTATLGESVGSTLVIVNVRDINDNAPRFVSEAGSAWTSSMGYNATLPHDALEESEVLTVQAEDIDIGANSVVYYEIDQHSTDAALFAIKRNSGAIVTRQQLPATKTQFEFRVIACDSPAETNRTLCTKARVRVNVVGRENRFLTVFTGASTVLKYKTEIGELLSQYTAPCTLLHFDSLENDDPQIAKRDIAATQNKPPKGQRTPQLRTYWYALATELPDHNGIERQRVCRTTEFRKLFTTSARDTLNLKLKKWGLRLIEVVAEPMTNTSAVGGIDQQLAATFLPLFNIHTGFGLMMWVLSCALIILVLACCTFCACRACDETRSVRKRRGGVSAIRRAYANGGIYQIPKYGQNNWNSVYLPNLTSLDAPTSGSYGAPPAGLNGGLEFGSLERDKYYESHMLELPVAECDLVQNNNKRFDSPSSIWSKSVSGGSGSGGGTINALYNHNAAMNGGTLLSGHIPHVSVSGNYAHQTQTASSGYRHTYGTTTTTMSSAVAGNGSGIPTPCGMMSGRGAAARAVQKAALTSSPTAATIVTDANDSASGEFSGDDDSTHQPLTYYSMSQQGHSRSNQQRLARLSLPKHAF